MPGSTASGSTSVAAVRRFTYSDRPSRPARDTPSSCGVAGRRYSRAGLPAPGWDWFPARAPPARQQQREQHAGGDPARPQQAAQAKRDQQVERQQQRRRRPAAAGPARARAPRADGPRPARPGIAGAASSARQVGAEVQRAPAVLRAVQPGRMPWRGRCWRSRSPSGRSPPAAAWPAGRSRPASPPAPAPCRRPSVATPADSATSRRSMSTNRPDSGRLDQSALAVTWNSTIAAGAAWSPG